MDLTTYKTENEDRWNEAVSRLLSTTRAYWNISYTPLSEQVRHLKRFYRRSPSSAPAMYLLDLHGATRRGEDAAV